MKKGEHRSEEQKAQHSRFMKKYWATLEAKKKAEMAANSSKAGKEYWKNASQEVLCLKSKMSSKNTLAFWQQLSPEEYKAHCSKLTVGLKKYQKTMSPEKRAAIAAKLRVIATGRKHTAQTKAKISKRSKELWKEGVLGSHTGMRGKHHSKGTKKRMREIQLTADHTTANRKKGYEKHSKWMADQIAKGDLWSQGFYYSFKNGIQIPFQSSYEARAFKILENMSGVFGFDRCHFSIPYKWPDGSKHHYIPDILVEWHDGTKEVIEVKPLHPFEDLVKLQLKTDAGKSYCQLRGWHFNFWTERELGLKLHKESK